MGCIIRRLRGGDDTLENHHPAQQAVGPSAGLSGKDAPDRPAAVLLTESGESGMARSKSKQKRTKVALKRQRKTRAKKQKTRLLGRKIKT